MHDVIDLPIERVNALSPYKVYINNNGSLGFETQYGSVYEVGFVEDYTFMDENAFQFFILESQGKHSVKDPLVRETIWVILETFFLENILLYYIFVICRMVNRLFVTVCFSMWYYEYEQRESLLFCSTKVEVESTDYYASVLVKNSNPQLEDIKVAFNSFIENMKEKINEQEIKKFNYYGNIFTVHLVITLLSAVPLFFWLERLAFIPFGILFVITMYWALKVEKVKKDNDIQTYKEIVAFSEGKRLDEIQKQREIGKRPYQNVLKMIVAAIVAIVVCFLIGLLFHLLGN